MEGQRDRLVTWNSDVDDIQSDIWKENIEQFQPRSILLFLASAKYKKKGDFFLFLLKGDSIILPIWQILQYVGMCHISQNLASFPIFISI